jgi:hypothetical protein
MSLSVFGIRIAKLLYFAIIFNAMLLLYLTMKPILQLSRRTRRVEFLEKEALLGV